MLCIYMATMLVVALVVHDSLQYYAVMALRSLKSEVPFWVFSLSSTLVDLLAIFIVLPFFIVAIALPVRIVWICGRLPLFKTLKDSAIGLHAAFSAQRLATRISLQRSKILMLLLLLRFSNFFNISNQNAKTLLTLALLVASIHALWRCYPVLLSPILAVCSEISGRSAVVYCESILRPRWWELLGAGTFGLGLITLIRSLLPQTRVSIFGFHLSSSSIIYSMIIWYLLTYVTFLISRAVAKEARQTTN